MPTLPLLYRTPLSLSPLLRLGVLDVEGDRGRYCLCAGLDLSVGATGRGLGGREHGARDGRGRGGVAHLHAHNALALGVDGRQDRVGLHLFCLVVGGLDVEWVACCVCASSRRVKESRKAQRRIRAFSLQKSAGIHTYATIRHQAYAKKTGNRREKGEMCVDRADIRAYDARKQANIRDN